jgi:hypothetical protein
MHSAITKQNDYNDVLNKLQDYMLTGKVLARTFYQQSATSDSELTRKKEEAKSVLKLIQKKEKEKEKEKEPDKFFYPREKDQLFWCFFIIQNGFEKYEYPDATSFVNEKTTKFKLIEHMRNNKQQLKSKKIKNIKEDVEDELANKQTIGMKTFIALCISHNINIMYIHKRKCFEIVFDDQMQTHVVHCVNNSDSSACKYCCEQNVSKEQLEKYRTEYFNWESFDKPLKAMSSYKLDELAELAKKMGLSENGIDLSKKTKKELYEMLVMNL